jgi:hypothetical protein
VSEPYYSDEHVTLYRGDCLDALRTLPDASVDAVVTDPPYNLSFIGKAWDNHATPGAFQAWCTEWAAECLRILKPGGHFVAFGGSRTWHRLAAGVEDAGFEIRDSIAWLYGSGFPKSLDVSKAIDRQRHDRDDVRRVTAWVASARAAAGMTNRDIDAAFGFNGMAGHWTTQGAQAAIPTLDQVPHLLEVFGLTAEDVPHEIRALLIDLNGMKGQPGPAWFAREVLATERRANEPSGIVGIGQGERVMFDRKITAPATDAARTWQGWGTALKPAFEPVVVARKPLSGTVAANVLAHGTGALNIDACRLMTHSDEPGTTPRAVDGGKRSAMSGDMDRVDYDSSRGRWPTNVALDESQAVELDVQSGVLSSGANPTRRGSDKFRDAYGDFKGQEECSPARGADSGGASRFFPTFRYEAKAPTSERPRVDGVAHPTVKPLDLMRWLVRLVTPPGGVVLEPFAGSGTTAEACVVEGFRCIAIEREADYLPLITSRLTKPIEMVLDFGVSA